MVLAGVLVICGEEEIFYHRFREFAVGISRENDLGSRSGDFAARDPIWEFAAGISRENDQHAFGNTFFVIRDIVICENMNRRKFSDSDLIRERLVDLLKSSRKSTNNSN